MSNLKVETDRQRRNADENKGSESAVGDSRTTGEAADHHRVSGNHHQDNQGDDNDGGDEHRTGSLSTNFRSGYSTGAADASAAADNASKYGESFGDAADARIDGAPGQKPSAQATGWRANNLDASGDNTSGGDASLGETADYKVPSFPTSASVKQKLADPKIQEAGRQLARQYSANDADAVSVVNGLANGTTGAMQRAHALITKNSTGTGTASDTGEAATTTNSKASTDTASGGLTKHELSVQKAKAAAASLAAASTADGTDEMADKAKAAKGQKTAGKAGGKASSGSGGKGAASGTDGGGGGGGGTSDSGGGLSGLSGMELVQAVMLAAADEASKSAQDLAKQVQSNTAAKNAIRDQLAPMRTAMADANQSGGSALTTEQKKTNADMSNLQDKMDAIGDDNQILFIKLQNATQQYSSMLQGCSNVSKTLFDIDKAVIGNIGH